LKNNKVFLTIIVLILFIGYILYSKTYFTIYGDIRFPAARGPNQTICAINSVNKTETCTDDENFDKNGLKVRPGKYTIYSTVNDEKSDERWDNLVGYKAFYNEYMKEDCGIYPPDENKKEKCNKLKEEINPVLINALPFKKIDGIKFDWLNSREYEDNMESLKSKTEVINYEQVYVPKKSKEGFCWTTSIASNLEKRWRCSTVDKYIYDPCFETDSGQVVCDVDSEIEGSGFELKLTEPLRKESKNNDSSEYTRYYKIELQNGLDCYLQTGTADEINNELTFYYCTEENTHLLGGRDGLIEKDLFDKSGEYWKVRLVHYDYKKDSGKTVPVENVNVVKVWE
jgi:hypothetical protein